MKKATVNLLIIDGKKEFRPQKGFWIRGATQLESDLFTANDYALITCESRKSW